MAIVTAARENGYKHLLGASWAVQGSGLGHRGEETATALTLSQFCSGGADKRATQIITGCSMGSEEELKRGGQTERLTEWGWGVLMGVRGGISVKVMSQPKGREGVEGREFQVEGTTRAKALRWKRAWHIPVTGAKPMRWEHNWPNKGKREMTLTR